MSSEDSPTSTSEEEKRRIAISKIEGMIKQAKESVKELDNLKKAKIRAKY